MSPGAGDVPLGRLAYTDHLVTLIGRAGSAAGRLAAADPQRRAAVAARARRESARLSARLDASPLDDATAAEVDAREAAADPPAQAPQATQVPQVPQAPPGAAVAGGEPAAGGWQRALKLDGMPTAEVAALEYANLLACHDAERDLAGRLFEEPAATLEALHGVICRGLVAPDVVGRLRSTEQAVHDGAQGLIVYNPPRPDRLPGLYGALTSWLGHTSVRYPALVVAGVVHERLLEWQPFEAANGRLARAAGRLVLRARGTDVDGAAVVERLLATDPLGYHREVAATIRRRGDLAGWLERFTEAAVAALEAAADAAAPRSRERPPVAAARFVEGLVAGEAVTLPAYAGARSVPLETARAELAALEAAGLLRLDPGSHGLRWRRL